MFTKVNRGWLLIAHIPLGGEFVSQPLHLKKTRDNKREAKRVKGALERALRAGALEAEFAKRFPNQNISPALDCGQAWNRHSANSR